MTRPAATIDDVAKLAGVSVGTVSNVLSGKVPVREARRTQVLQAIEALGYVPNSFGRALRQGRSNLIGICFPHVSTAYLNQLSETLEDLIASDGFASLHVFSRQSSQTELARVRELLALRVDGLILLPSPAPEPTFQIAADHRVPLVVVDRPTGDRRFDHVVLNNRAGMRDCVNRLIALGHRRLLFVCRRRTMLVAQYRIDGLIAAQRAATMPLAVDIVELLDDESRLLAELTRLCAEPDPPTAIIVSNNRQASYLLRALRVLGIESPRTVSVLAFDDPEWSELVTPRLSVVRQPAVAIARAAWRTLRRRLDDVDAPVRTIAMKQVIDFRESIGPAPARG